tara:strand:+ start:12038 stop:12331 length:294 start_codon:yes stop_codon:yes gene_type:complete
MKTLITVLTSVSLLTVSVPLSYGAEPAATSSATEEAISAPQRAGRVLGDVLHLAGSAIEAAGSGLQWVGKNAKNVASGAGKGMSNLGAKLSRKTKKD